MKTLNTLGSLIDRCVWAVGCFTIIRYSMDHWPVAAQVTIAALLLAFGVWYGWRFFMQPLKAGLRGE